MNTHKYNIQNTADISSSSFPFFPGKEALFCLLIMKSAPYTPLKKALLFGISGVCAPYFQLAHSSFLHNSSSVVITHYGSLVFQSSTASLSSFSILYCRLPQKNFFQWHACYYSLSSLLVLKFFLLKAYVGSPYMANLLNLSILGFMA